MNDAQKAYTVLNLKHDLEEKGMEMVMTTTEIEIRWVGNDGIHTPSRIAGFGTIECVAAFMSGWVSRGIHDGLMK